MTWRALLALLALAGAGPAAAQGPPTPKIVVQAVQIGGVEVAAFTPDGRYLATASGLDRELLLWDVATGHLVDRLRLPAASGSTTELMQLDDMQISADGRSLTVRGQLLISSAPDLRQARTFTLDIHTRKISAGPAAPLPPLPAGESWPETALRRIHALAAIYGNDPSLTRAEADRALPALPRAPDGRILVRRAPAWALLAAGGGAETMPAATRLVSIEDADLSGDDTRIALLHSNVTAAEDLTMIDVMEIATGQFLPSVNLAGTYDEVRWTGADTYLALPRDSDDDPLDGATEGPPPDVVRVQASTGKLLSRHPARCFMALLPDGSLVGGALGNCRSGAGADTSLQRLGPAGWTVLPGFEMPAGAHIRAIAASPRGDRLFVATRLENGDTALEIADPATGKVRDAVLLDTGVETTMAGFSADGNSVWLAANGGISEWTPGKTDTAGKPALRDFDVRTLLPTRFAARGNRLLIGGFTEEQVQVVDLASGKGLRPVPFPGAAALGFMHTRPFIWAASTIEGLRIWDAESGRIVLTTAFLPDQKFVTVAPDGRYDSNLGPDSESFRWLMSDRPFQSLAPQTLMRDYYLPQMASKLLDCTAAGSCARVLKPLPPLAGLNRLLPQVAITGIRAADVPGQVVISVEARETREGSRSSGLYGLKLLLNNRQIEQDPPHFQQQPGAALAEWRETNLLEGIDAGGVWRGEFQLPVPTHRAGQTMEFAAYAFNADRVKSDTTRRQWTAPPTPPRPRRAWVVTIGVDDYAERRLTLNYAVADAKVIAGRLAEIPGFEMRHISLTSARAPDGTPARQVTRADIRGVLSFLSGFPPDMDQVIRLQDVHGLKHLEQTTPDDIVILSFSGHGHADAAGQFALVPSDARWPVGAAPDANTVVSAEDLTIWLGFMQAAEIAFIIDACHSGAAVDTPDFKPGPMGDASLGQLAFDKGLRILAATQANDVAQENAALGLGFLTAALGAGLTPAGGPADLDRDGRVRLDEWLKYAVNELPAVAERARRGGGAAAQRGVLLDMTGPAEPAKVQLPSLFDFNTEASPVVLRGRP